MRNASIVSISEARKKTCKMTFAVGVCGSGFAWQTARARPAAEKRAFGGDYLA
jgi:hypothetical protein